MAIGNLPSAIAFPRPMHDTDAVIVDILNNFQNLMRTLDFIFRGIDIKAVPISELIKFFPKNVTDLLNELISKKLPREEQWDVVTLERVKFALMEFSVNRRAKNMNNIMQGLAKKSFQLSKEYVKEIQNSFDLNMNKIQNLIINEEDLDKITIYHKILLSIRDIISITEKLISKFSNTPKLTTKDRLNIYGINLLFILQYYRMNYLADYLGTNKEKALEQACFLNKERHEMNHYVQLYLS